MSGRRGGEEEEEEEGGRRQGPGAPPNPHTLNTKRCTRNQGGFEGGDLRPRGGEGCQEALGPRQEGHPLEKYREFCFDNLLVRIHLIIEMTLVDRPCAMGI